MARTLMLLTCINGRMYLCVCVLHVAGGWNMKCGIGSGRNFEAQQAFPRDE